MRLPISGDYLVPFRSYRSLLFKYWTLCFFEPPFGGLGTTYDVHLRLIGKRIVDFLLVLIKLLLRIITDVALQAKIGDLQTANFCI